MMTETTRMAGYAHQDLLARVKELSILEILAHYIALKGRGGRHTALCPFHNDTRPSLQVSEKKGFFKCFACGMGGDAITFVQEYKKLNFPAALVEIAQKCGLPVDTHPSSRSQNPQYLKALQLNQLAAKFFRTHAQSPQCLEFAKFLQQRAIPPEMATQFTLGYAPGRNALTQQLSALPPQERDPTLAMACQLGLIHRAQKPQTGFYDTFRERIIFPIWDPYDKVVGFASRAVFEHQKVKYVNSQQSFLFNKRQLLYGLNFAQPSIRERGQVIVVEGYMDCLALVKNGLPQTVAVMGVAMADRMVKKLAEMAPDIVLGFDSDDAGLQAAKRVHKAFLQVGALPRYLNYAPYKDPDEFLQNQSRIELMQRVEAAPVFLDQLIADILAQGIPRNTDHKLARLTEIFHLVAPLKQALTATERILGVAKKLQLRSSEQQIIDCYQQFLATQRIPRSPGQETSQPRTELLQTPPPGEAGAANPPPATAGPEAATKLEASKRDALLLEALAAHPECFNYPSHQGLLDYLSCHEVKQVVMLLKSIYFEVSEAHYPKMVQSALEGGQIGSSIMAAVAGGLMRFTGEDLATEQVEKLLGDLKKRLARECLVEQRNQFKAQRKGCATDQEDYELIGKINLIQQQLNKLQYSKMER